MMMFEICLFYSTLQMYGIFLTLPCDWKSTIPAWKKKRGSISGTSLYKIGGTAVQQHYKPQFIMRFIISLNSPK